MTQDEALALVKAAQEYDLAHRAPATNWCRVPDDQVWRLLVGAGLVANR